MALVNYSGLVRRDLGGNLDTAVKGPVKIVGAKLIGNVGTKRLVNILGQKFLVDDIDTAGNAEEFNAIDADATDSGVRVTAV